MSKRHQASRRRSYGRRLHELHERPDLPVAAGFGAGQEGDEAEANVATAAYDVERRLGPSTFELVA